MDPPPLWSFLFFFMLINLALSSICGGVQTFVAFLTDEWPVLANHRKKVLVAIAILFFLIALPMCARGGIHLFTIFDNSTTSSLLFLTLLEVIVVSWVYGINQFLVDLREMDVKMWTWVEWVWKIVLVVLTPAVLVVITILTWINHEDLAFNDYVFPEWAQGLGWAMELVPLAIVLLWPFWSIYRLSKKHKGGELWKALVRPTESWYTTDRGVQSEEFDDGKLDGLDILETKSIHSAQGFGMPNKAYEAEKDNIKQD